jgi:hypothetical protein
MLFVAVHESAPGTNCPSTLCDATLPFTGRALPAREGWNGQAASRELVDHGEHPAPIELSGVKRHLQGPANRYQLKMPKSNELTPLGRVLCRWGRGGASARRGASAGRAATSAASGSGFDGVTYDLVKTNCSGVAADFLLSDPNSELARQRWSALPSPARQLSRQTGSEWL